MSWELIGEHLFIVLAAGILSILVGLPLGVAAYLAPKARAAILRVVDLFQTVPSLALLGILMVFLGPGKVTVVAPAEVRARLASLGRSLSAYALEK